MSNQLLPALVGLTWDTTKAPVFNTIVQTSVDLSELRGSFTGTPIYEFTRTYELLRDDVANDELKTLAGFFLARQGKWDSWLFADPDDSVATAVAFATGDGSTTEFLLTRTYGDFTEPVLNVGANAQIFANGVLQSAGADYTVESNAAILFANAPAANTPLTWTGVYYHRCRFKEDTTEFNQFMSQLWEAKQFAFTGTLGNKL